jgi:cytochrome P450
MACGSGLRTWGLLHAIHSLSVERDLEMDAASLTAMALELMLGGQETSASALTSAILALGKLATHNGPSKYTCIE